MADLLEIPINLKSERRILHIDMDAFYAQVEMRDHPEYRSVALILARDPRTSGGHGVVATANYPARKLGVHSAMSSAEALRLAPDAVFLPPNFDLYREVSEQVHEIFYRLTRKVESVALDEVYLDITDSYTSFQDAIMVGHQLQQSIYAELNLTSSIGISYNKFLAKLASEHNKPVGLTVVKPSEIRSFLDPMPIEEIRGVGIKTAEKMHTLKIETGRDLFLQNQSTLLQNFGKMGYEFYRRIRGVDDRQVEWQRERKSIGKERTYNPFLDTEEQVAKELRHITELLVTSLDRRQMQGKTLVIKTRTEDFETETRRKSFTDLIPNDIQFILEEGQALFEELGGYQRPLRLLGLTITNLQNQSQAEILLPLF